MGCKCHATVSLIDLFATCAEIVGVELGQKVAEDSYSIMPMLKGKDVKRPVPVVHHSVSGMFAIREGKWKLVLGNGSGGREKPVGKPFGKPYQLFDMTRDNGETENLAYQYPEVVEDLTAKLEAIRRQ